MEQRREQKACEYDADGAGESALLDVCRNGMRVGVLSMQVPRAAEDGGFSLVLPGKGFQAKAAQHCALASADGAAKAQTMRLVNIMNEMASGKNVSHGALSNALQVAGWTMQGDFICLSTVDIAKPRGARAHRREAESVCAGLRNIMALVRAERTTYIARLDRDEWNVPRLAQSVAAHACIDRQWSHVGVSSPFSSMADFTAYCKSSVRAVSLGRMANDADWIHYFDELLFDYLCLDCVSSAKMHVTVPHEIYLLREYDKDNGTDFLRFMRVYLENERSITYTAHDLGIHKNTVVNRIQKVEEVSKADFGSAETRLRLMTALVVMEKMGI